MFIPKSKLDSMNPSLELENSSVYYLNSFLVAIRFKNLRDVEKQILYAKYIETNKIKKLNGVMLPIDIIEDENGLCGYLENKVSDDALNFADIVNKDKNISLNDISTYMLRVCDIVSDGQKNGIINPDMSSIGNVLYDPKTKKVYFLDYQGMQVNKLPTDAVDSFIYLDPVVNTKKYFYNCYWTTNIDLYTLTIRYLYYATRINIPKSMSVPQNRINPVDFINNVLHNIGISNTEFGECLRTLYNPNKNNMDIRYGITELNNKYKLTDFEINKPRTFVKK